MKQESIRNFETQANDLVHLALDISNSKDGREGRPWPLVSRTRHQAIATLEAMTKVLVLLLKL